jgi:protein phosphatase 1 regulatory subunit 7
MQTRKEHTLSEERIVDYTGYHVHFEEDPELFAPNALVLDLTNTRMRQLPGHLTQMTCLEKLILRQNLLSSLEPLSQMPMLSTLRHLDLYDNKLHTLQPESAFTHLTLLTRLDVSFNALHSHTVSPVSLLTRLIDLYFVNNHLTAVPSEVRLLTCLKTLELGSNRIRVLEMTHFETLVNLENLWLGRNKISRIQCLNSLVNLRRLSIQSNRLTAIEGLSALTSLEELYLSHNGIWSIEGLERLVRLKTLDISSNRVTSLQNLSHLVQLEELWMNDNQIQYMSEVRRLSVLTNLQTIYLEGNPLSRDVMYRNKVLLELRLIGPPPHSPMPLTQLDATPIVRGVFKQ